MSNWLSEYSGEEQKQVDDLNAQGLQHKPIKGKIDPSLFQGSLTAPFRGAAVGFAKVADVIMTPVDAAVDRTSYAIKYMGSDDSIEPYSNYQASKKKARDDLTFGTIDYLEDKENTGFIGNLGVGIGDFATRAILGSAAGGLGGAIAVTGGSETNYSYKDLTRKGVDSDTALGVSLIDGVVAGGSAALPMMYGFKGTGGLIKDAALSVGGATGLSVGGQALSGEVLESSGYEKQAKKYEITWESFGTEAALNAFIFGGSRYAKYKLSDDVDVELRDLTVEEIEAKNTAVEATLEVNRMQFENETSPVNLADPIQENNHLINLNTAEQQLRAGQPVNVPKNVQGTAKTKAPVNYESMALPTNAKTIARQAQQAGIDPSVALTIAQMESNFSHTVRPPIGKDGKPLSSAHGLYQVLDRTWKRLGGGNRNDVNEQIRIGFKHMKEAERHIKKQIGRDLQPHEQYLGHLLGPGGASRVLKANPNTPLIDVVRKYDAKNAEAIVNNNGMKGLTAGQAITKWRNKWKQVSAKYGEPSKATGMDGSSYDMAYEIKSLEDLIASNDAAFGVNPNYPAELQPRDRTRAASMQQIEDMANGLRPEFLGESPKLSDGAPILGPDGVVESGNGRTMAIRQAYETGKADNYRSFLDQYAREKGWDISGINNPVLVRTRLTETDRVEFARLANESDVAQYSSTERARTDADRLPDSSAIKINNDGSINLDGSMDFVRGFLDQLPQSERANLMTADGRLSQGGKQRIESALAQRAYGDSNLVTRLYENLDDDSKTVLNALLRAAPQLTQLGDLVKQGGRHQNTIAADLAQAAQKLSDLKANGQTVKDYLNQGQLIDDGLSPGAKEFLNVFDSNSRSAKAISEQIQAKIDEVEARGDPRQGSLFGETAEEQAALEIIMNNPDQKVSVSRVDPDGNIEEITMTLRQRLDELEAEAKQVQEDSIAAQAAANCALKFGA